VSRGDIPGRNHSCPFGLSIERPVFTAKAQSTQRVIFLLFSVEKDGKQQT